MVRGRGQAWAFCTPASDTSPCPPRLLTGGSRVRPISPYGSFIKGMPRVMYEGFLQSIDIHIQLYATCRGGTYNQRAVSSLVNETFFSELGELEPTQLGCPKATNIPWLLSTVTELLHYRHNPAKRLFCSSVLQNR